MSELHHQRGPTVPVSTPEPSFFSAPPAEPSRRWAALLGLAAIVLAVIAGILVLRGHHDATPAAQNAALPADPYAPNLPLTQLAMSQSTSLSGGTSTFIDGHVRNSGQSTVTGATVQVILRNEVALPPDIETLPLALIRTHEPYVDTEPIAAAPLKPGDEVEFRLVIENMPANWNQQMPEIQVIRVSKK